MTDRHMAPDRHRQQDLFFADILDANPKDDMPSMEHPLFALRAGDRRVRTYEKGNVSVTVKPGYDGCATIHDKDLWIYCISQLVEAQNRGREINARVRFTMYDFLRSTNRRTDGDSYKRAAEMLGRLKGTVIETNIETDGKRERAGFGLLDAWRVIEKDNSERMVAVEVELPQWLYRSVRAMKVKTLSRDYFRLRKALDRRIYEIAKKHCGDQPKWVVGLDKLHLKSGTTGPLKRFRLNIKGLADADALPDYRLVYNAKSDSVTFYSRGSKGGQAQVQDTLKLL